MLRVLAIVLVVTGSCLVCFAMMGAGWALWLALSGAGWSGDLPSWGWLVAAVPGGVALAIAGREVMKRAENR